MAKRIASFGVVWCVLLAALGFAQSVKILADPQFAHRQSIYDAVGWNAVLVEGLRGRVDEPRAPGGQAKTCPRARSVLLDISAWDRGGKDFREVPVWQLLDRQAFFFISGMTIDADGSPNAYHPDDAADDAGLDELANAGKPGHWDGIITDPDGDPLIQQERDPFPGYYISCTSLSDKTKTFTDPTRYVNASKIPYVVLPQEVSDRGGARLGDFAVVVNLHNGKSSFAIFADVGTLGEGSVALADALGIQSDARHGGESDGILYLVFPGSGNRQPRTTGEIQSEGKKLLMDHGGEMTNLSSCVESDNPEGNGEF
ncbi:MAG: glycoside hydrolase family 75 protein [Candidatus Sulfotelmatobacter sp.]